MTTLWFLFYWQASQGGGGWQVTLTQPPTATLPILISVQEVLEKGEILWLECTVLSLAILRPWESTWLKHYSPRIRAERIQKSPIIFISTNEKVHPEVLSRQLLHETSDRLIHVLPHSSSTSLDQKAIKRVSNAEKMRCSRFGYQSCIWIYSEEHWKIERNLLQVSKSRKTSPKMPEDSPNSLNLGVMNCKEVFHISPSSGFWPIVYKNQGLGSMGVKAYHY